MADDVRAEEFRDQLRETFAERIRRAAPDLPPAHALQLADALVTTQMDVLAAKRVTYRACEPVGGREITDSWNEGLKVAEIMSRHSCSKATAYRWHPQVSKASSKGLISGFSRRQKKVSEKPRHETF